MDIVVYVASRANWKFACVLGVSGERSELEKIERELRAEQARKFECFGICGERSDLENSCEFWG